MKPHTILHLAKIAILSQHHLEQCKQHLIRNFNQLIVADGGDDDFAEIDDSLSIAKGLVAFVAPIEYCTMEGGPIGYDRYLELYGAAKQAMLGISQEDETVINYISK